MTFVKNISQQKQNTSAPINIYFLLSFLGNDDSSVDLLLENAINWFAYTYIYDAYLLEWRALPAIMRKGTPSHRGLSTKRVAAANVGVRLFFATVGSSV